MREISHILRKAYLDLLNPLAVDGVIIPIFDERVNPKSTIPTLKGGKVFVIIKDQNEAETTNNQCNYRKTATVTLDIVARYPLNVGSKLTTELISDEIQQKVREGIQMADFQVLATRLDFSRNTIENGDTDTIYRKIIAFNHTINQQ